MKVLVACEESQAVCIAFRAKGHEAYSCDIQECSGGYPEWHIQGDALKEANSGKYDLMIAHPPCTYLSYAGNRVWNIPGRRELRKEAMQFFMDLYNSDIKKVCIENPHGLPRMEFRQPDQEIHPYFFGDPFVKRTCLWLRGLEPLQHYEQDSLFGHKKTHVEKPKPGWIRKDGNKQYFCSTTRDPKLRSKTFPGIAATMAEQWGNHE